MHLRDGGGARGDGGWGWEEEEEDVDGEIRAIFASPSIHHSYKLCVCLQMKVGKAPG